MANSRATRTDRRPKLGPSKQSAKKPVSPPRTAILLRWCILGAAVFVAYLYYQPLASYFETRAALNARAAEVAELREDRVRLEKRLKTSTTVAALALEARRMRLVRPGERLFIVKGVKDWRRAYAQAKQEEEEKDRATIAR